MKFTRLVLVLILASGLHLGARAQENTAAIDLNDKISAITDTLYQMGGAWGEMLGKAMQDGNFSQLTVQRKKMISFLDRKKLEVMLMKDVNGSEQLRLAMLGFLFFESDMIAEYFTQAEKLTKSSSDDEIQGMISSIEHASQFEGERIQLVIDQQVLYAQKNGFRLEVADKTGNN